MKLDAHEKLFIPVFLGKRGGGEQLYLETLELFENLGINYLPVISADVYSRFKHNKAVVFNLPHTFKDILKFGYYLSSFKSMLQLSRALKQVISGIYLIQLMPSPFDLTLDYLAKIKKIKVIRCIHDIKPHLGEKWPTQKAIKRRIQNADLLISFSDAISHEISKITSKEVIKANLPSRIYSETVSLKLDETSMEADTKIVILGRAKTYKGYSVLADALPKVKAKYNFSALGEGDYPEKLKLFGRIDNRWLTNSELYFEMSNADIIVFPYIEGSQSGLIPLAIGLNKFIIITNIAGLMEQVRDYPYSIVVPAGDSVSLAVAIENSIELVSKNSNFRNKSTPVITNSNSLGRIVYNYVQSKN